MSYKNNIPLATDLLSQSQDDIKNNFAGIKTLVDINHVTFDASGQGKHHFVQLPVQSPVPTTTTGEVGLYCKTSTITGNPELVFAPVNNGTTYEFTSSVKNATGYAMLPSGIILKWGTGTINANTTATATFCAAAGVPVFTTVYNIQVSRVGTTGDTGIIYVQSNTTTEAVLFNTADASKTYYYLVIGV